MRWNKLNPLSGKLKKPKRFRCKLLKSTVKPSDRQERVKGWDQSALRSAHVLMVGCGGLGSQVGQNLARQGVGHLTICDPDEVAPENLATQMYTQQNLWHNKAYALGKNLSRQAVMGTQITAYPCLMQDINIPALQSNIIVGCVDNRLPSTRLEICKMGRQMNIPVVILGVSTEATNGYIMIQKPRYTCWACIMKPELQQTNREDQVQCPAVPATICPLSVLAGLTTYAVDSLLMPKINRDWNYWYFSLNQGASLGGASMVTRRHDCAVCGTGHFRKGTNHGCPGK